MKIQRFRSHMEFGETGSGGLSPQLEGFGFQGLVFNSVQAGAAGLAVYFVAIQKPLELEIKGLKD